MKRVAVTGIGIISPAGNNQSDFFNNLMSGVSGIKRLPADFFGDFSERLSIKVAARADFNPTDHFSKKQLNALDRTSQLALIAASQAWKDSGIMLGEEQKERAGVSMGTGLGGAQSLDDLYLQLYNKDAARISPLFITKVMCNASASHIAIQYGLTGPCLTFSTACSSSSVAIGEAYHQISAGRTDVMLCGGAEGILTYGSFKCWESLGVLAVENTEDPASSCRPFSKDRAGIVLGEGAAVIVLEEMERAEKRGAQIYGEITGYGSTCDAHHITGPDVKGQAQAMQLALNEACIAPESINYINAHGTATVANDIIETQAIKKVFGEMAYKVPISSTKSMHGHMMGAGGAVEFTAALLAIKNNAVPPTAHLRVPDPECDLDYVPNTGRTGINVKTVMSNSFAFGGTNAVLIARAV